MQYNIKDYTLKHVTLSTDQFTVIILDPKIFVSGVSVLSLYPSLSTAFVSVVNTQTEERKYYSYKLNSVINVS